MNGDPVLRKPDCWTCTQSIGADLRTAQDCIARGYQRGPNLFPHNYGLVCPTRQITGPAPCRNYQPIAGQP